MTKYLRNRKTGAVFIWSKYLAGHPDCEPVKEPDPVEIELEIPKRERKKPWRKVLRETAEQL